MEGWEEYGDGRFFSTFRGGEGASAGCCRSQVPKVFTGVGNYALAFLFQKPHCLSQVRICFSLRDLLFSPTIRRLSTLHLQPHKLSPKRWSTCALGAEILPHSRWTGITSTAVVGEPPAIATPRVLQRVRTSSAGARVPRDREASRK